MDVVRCLRQRSLYFSPLESAVSNNELDMKLRNYIEDKVSDWIGYNRPAVDWMTTESGKGIDVIYVKAALHVLSRFGMQKYRQYLTCKSF